MDCQKVNLKGVPLMAAGVNKSAEQYVLADEKSQDEMASGTYRDQRRGLYGKPAKLGTTDSTPAPAGAGTKPRSTGARAVGDSGNSRDSRDDKDRGDDQDD